jgi:hypothetical protein
MLPSIVLASRRGKLSANISACRRVCSRAAGERPVLGAFLNDLLDVLAEVVDYVEG